MYSERRRVMSAIFTGTDINTERKVEAQIEAEMERKIRMMEEDSTYSTRNYIFQCAHCEDEGDV